MPTNESEFAEFHRHQMHMDIERQDREWGLHKPRSAGVRLAKIAAGFLIVASLAWIISLYLTYGSEPVVAHSMSGKPDMTVVE